MAIGLFRTGDSWAHVRISRTEYEENGCEPAFESLPLEAVYRAAQEKAGSNDSKSSETNKRLADGNGHTICNIAKGGEDSASLHGKNAEAVALWAAWAVRRS